MNFTNLPRALEGKREWGGVRGRCSKEPASHSQNRRHCLGARVPRVRKLGEEVREQKLWSFLGLEDGTPIPQEY